MVPAGPLVSLLSIRSYRTQKIPGPPAVAGRVPTIIEFRIARMVRGYGRAAGLSKLLRQSLSPGQTSAAATSSAPAAAKVGARKLPVKA